VQLTGCWLPWIGCHGMVAMEGLLWKDWCVCTSHLSLALYTQILVAVP